MESNQFGVVDYIVVAGTLLFSLLIGIYHAVVKKQTNEDLFLGGRNTSVLPVACSIVVTYFSAIAIQGYPGEIYSHGVQIFQAGIMISVFMPIALYLLVSVLYQLRLTSVYEYLELRFESVALRRLAGIAFIIQFCVVTGVVLFAPSIALETILGVPVWVSVAGMGICGTIYTSIGGLKTVVWTDLFQFIMIFTGLVTIAARGFYKAGGISEAFKTADKHGRLDLFDWTVDPFMRHNTLNFILGYGFNVICLYGASQQQVQRYCSLPSFKDCVKAIWLSVILNLLTMTVLIAAGLAVFANYAGCDPKLLGKITRSDQVLAYFVLKELAFIPGMLGLFVACVFSGVLSTLSSTLNSFAAVTWKDFLSHLPRFKSMDDRGQANTSKILAGFYGIITIALGFMAQHMGPVLQACLTAVGAVSGPLGAVLIMGMFMPCVNKWGAFVGTITALVSMMSVGVMSFQLDKPFVVPLPTNIDECPFGTDMSTVKNVSLIVAGEFEWPEKIFTLSYIMYPFVGGLLSMIVSLLVSLITGGCSKAKFVKKEYLHPLLRPHFGASKVELHENPSKAANFRGIFDGVNGKYSEDSTSPNSLNAFELTPLHRSPYKYEDSRRLT
ncbi:unnamed protein product [Allacma fusca]|uniref:Sodium-coupled monocarboxylate transporter 1 n=1 Tax=Allacma fusca TaxID=39272 RepID=A0A8J2PS99_9HEXA|nr:unnamed protein product [Allacma fusca]